MPDFFEFQRTSAYLTERLTANQVNAVTAWQRDTLDYQFSFHTQHEAGWPCYLVEPDGPVRNLPKINLKVPTNPPTVLQASSIRTPAVGVDFRAVITANIALFQELAEPYYEGVETGVVKSPAWAVVFKCTVVRNAKPIVIELPGSGQVNHAPIWWSNFKNRQGVWQEVKDIICSIHKKNDCLVTEVVSFPPEKFGEIRKYFAETGKVVDY